MGELRKPDGVGGLPVSATLRQRYEELERQSRELLNRDFSLVERFVTNSKLAKLADRLAVEEQEEALRGRLEAMQLMRVTALNEQQIRLRAFLSTVEVESGAGVVERVAQIYANLYQRLADYDFELAEAYESHRSRGEQLKTEEMRQRYKENLLKRLEQTDKTIQALMDSTNQALQRLGTAYAERSPTAKR